VSVVVPAPPVAVWGALARVEDHMQWMADARRIEFLGSARRGVGTRIRVDTRIGPFHTSDVMEFTDWSEPTSMGVTHAGVFTGAGRFTLAPQPEGTRFTWTEEIAFPWYLGGPAGAWVARPVLRRIWLANLRRFAAGFSAR